MLMQNELMNKQKISNERISKYGEFIKRYSSIRSFVLFRPGKQNNIMNPSLRTNASLDDTLTNQLDTEFDFLTDTQSIQEISALFPTNTDLTFNNEDPKVGKFYNIAMSAYNRGMHKKMTFRKYLIWRLELINDEKKPISIKAAIGLVFSSLVGMYWFFTPKTKPLIKILMGILNLLAVAVLICAIVLNLSLYFLISVAIVYGLFAIADCIHVGLKRCKENVEYQTKFSNTYNELMAYLKQEQTKEQTKSLQHLIDKINSDQKEKGMGIITEENEDIKSDSDKINSDQKEKGMDIIIEEENEYIESDSEEEKSS